MYWTQKEAPDIMAALKEIGKPCVIEASVPFSKLRCTQVFRHMLRADLLSNGDDISNVDVSDSAGCTAMEDVCPDWIVKVHV